MSSRPALVLYLVFSATVLRSACAGEPTPDIEWTVVDEGERPGLSDPCYTGGLVIVTSRPTQAKAGKDALVAIDPYFGQ